MLTAPAVRNEQTKLLATAVNNLGVAVLVTGGIGPIVGYVMGSLPIDDPLRLVSFVVICSGNGVGLLRVARTILEDLV